MQSQIVLYKGNYWPSDDGTQGVTETSASPDGVCYGLTHLHPQVPQTIATYVPQKRVVIQAGGNAGFYVKQYAQLFETVYTFEPIPVLFYCMNRNVESSNVFKFQACLGDSHEFVDLGRKLDNNAGSANVVGLGKTPTLRIDDFQFPVCDLIHLDIEGYEHKALKGAEETIRRCKPVLVIECFERWLERFDTSIELIESYLATLHYKQVGDVHGDRVYWYCAPTREAETL